MIFYTEVPIEAVLKGMDEQRAPYQEIRINGITMQVQPVSANEATIVRLISPDPNDFLNPAYAPGQTIRYQPVIE